MVRQFIIKNVVYLLHHIYLFLWMKDIASSLSNLLCYWKNFLGQENKFSYRKKNYQAWQKILQWKKILCEKKTHP